MITPKGSAKPIAWGLITPEGSAHSIMPAWVFLLMLLVIMGATILIAG
jgi:hypothetical protein